MDLRTLLPLIIFFLEIHPSECDGDLANEILPGKLTKMMFSVTLDVPSNYRDDTSTSRLMILEAFRFACMKVNQHNYLYNYTIGLGYIQNWSPWKDDITDLLSYMNKVMFSSKSTMIIGPDTSASWFIANLATQFTGFASISYGATSSQFDSSGKSLFRTLPSDAFRSQALIELIEKLGWIYFGMLSSAREDGEYDANFVANRLFEIDICADLLSFENSDKSFIDKELKLTLEQWNKQTNIKAIILFTSIPDTVYFLSMVKLMKLENRFFFIFFYGRPILDSQSTRGFETALAGSLSIELAVQENKEFKEHFLNTNLFNLDDIHNIKGQDWHLPYLLSWQNVFKCNPFSLTKTKGHYKRYIKYPDKNCTGKEKPSLGNGYYPEVHVNNIINAVYAYAFSLRKVIELECNKFHRDNLKNQTYCKLGIDGDVGGLSILKSKQSLFLQDKIYPDLMLKATVPWDHADKDEVRYKFYNFQYNMSSKISQNVVVGHWSMNRSSIKNYPVDIKTAPHEFVYDVTRMWWRQDLVGVNPTEIRCTDECMPGEIMLFWTIKCCWKCNKCPFNHIVINNTCVKCEKYEKADLITNQCQRFPLHHEEIIQRPTAIFFTVTMFIQLFIIVIFVIVIMKNYKDNIIQASGSFLWFTILIGIMFMLVIPMPYLLKPSLLPCLFRVGLPGLAASVLYTSIFLKCYRIKQTFFGMKGNSTNLILSSPQMQMITVIGIIITELLIIFTFQVSKVDWTEKQLSDDSAYYTVYCVEDLRPTPLVISLIIGLSFLVASTCVAFTIRRYPHNQHEARSICYTLFFSDCLWAVFLPIYYMTPAGEHHYRQYEMCGFTLLLGMVSLIGLFGSKVNMLLSNPLPPEPVSQGRNECQSASLSKVPSNQDISLRELKAFLDKYCPPQPIQRRITLHERDQVFTGDATGKIDSL